MNRGPAAAPPPRASWSRSARSESRFSASVLSLHGSKAWSADRVGERQGSRSTAAGAIAADQEAALELIGTQVSVPGAYWLGRMSVAEKETLYICVVRDFSALHKFYQPGLRAAGDGRGWHWQS